MAENKTQPSDGDVAAFLNAAEPAARRTDAQALCDLMARATGEPPVMWGASIVGFGSYTYRLANGRAATMCRVGFSPRKAALVMYGLGIERNAALLDALGKHSTGKGCLYVKKLADIDPGVLEALIATAFRSAAVGEWQDEA